MSAARALPMLLGALLSLGCSPGRSDTRKPEGQEQTQARESSSKEALSTETEGTGQAAQLGSSPDPAARPFPPVVAGMFYPREPEKLSAMVERLLNAAPRHELPEPLLGLMVPHAGLRYSGLAAAHAYRSLQGRSQIELAVVLAPSHRLPAAFASTLDRPAYRTPLGDVPIDRALARRLVKACPVLRFEERLFAQEHSLEVQLPFLQKVLPRVAILPVILGNRSPGLTRELARALHEALGQRTDVVYLASSDMSHYLPYEEAERRDAESLEIICRLDFDGLHRALAEDRARICGGGPVAVLTKLLDLKGKGQALVLFHNSSGDTAGDKERVVGYGVVAFGGLTGEAGQGPDAAPTEGSGKPGAKSPSGYQLSPEEKRLLLKLARDTVELWVKEGRVPDFEPPPGPLSQHGAAFVTLKKQGQLRGCIGHVIAHVPLWECIRDVASSAATRDSRFPRVRPRELPDLRYEVSVLTPMQPLPDPTRVRVGTDGLMVSWKGRRGILLPQVPGELGWSRQEFLSATCRKAGLPLDCWKKGARFEHFQALVFHE